MPFDAEDRPPSPRPHTPLDMTSFGSCFRASRARPRQTVRTYAFAIRSPSMALLDCDGTTRGGRACIWGFATRRRSWVESRVIVLPWAGVDGEPRVAAFVRLGKRSPPGSAPTLWLLRTTSGI